MAHHRVALLFFKIDTWKPGHNHVIEFSLLVDFVIKKKGHDILRT